MTNLRPAVMIFSVLVSAITSAGDWPGWRGPFRDDVSTETDLLRAWPSSGPPKLWTSTEAGIGYSSFAVVGNRLYTLGALEDEEFLIVLDAGTGETLWQTAVGPRRPDGRGDGPRSTPIVEGDRVVALGAAGRIVCATTDNGTVLWSAELTELGGAMPRWGYSESPLIDQGRVLCTPGGDNGAVAALDLKSGKILWQSSEVRQPAHYSSIIVAEYGSQRQYIQLGPESVFGLSAEDGQLLWEVPWPGRIAVIPTPITHDGSVYVASGYGVGSMLVDISSGNEADIRWRNKVMKNHHGGVIRVGEFVYGFSDGRGWICQDLHSGKMMWNEKRILAKGSIACADGMLYCLEENTGICALVRGSPDGWE